MKTFILIFVVIFSFVFLFSSENRLLLKQNEIVQIPSEFHSKIGSGFLINQISVKQKLIRDGIRDDNTEYLKVILYFSEYPSRTTISNLTSLGCECFLESWTPPLENHPLGYIVAKIPTEHFSEILPFREIMRIDTAEHKYYPKNNRAYKAINADDVWSSGYTGSGIKIAVLDSGLDSYYDGTDLPSTYDKKDYSNYPTLDNDVENHVTGHGTHVTGSVLGRGHYSASNTANGGGAYKGMAPDASLIFLKIGNDSNGSASDDAIINALDAADNTYNADIITMSYGGWSDYHDGSDALCQKADECYNDGIAVFMSAGNEADESRHYSGTVNANSSTGYIRVDVTGNSQALYFNLAWYDGTTVDNDLELEYYNSSYTKLTSITDFGTTESSRGTESRISYYNYYVNDGETYYLKVVNHSANNQDFHIYDYWGHDSSGNGIYFYNPDPYYTIGSPAEADHVCAVAAWTTDRTWKAYDGYTYYFPSLTDDDICPFSNRGPRIDAYQKPDITAPGAAIISIRDTDVYTSASGYWVDDDGTTGDGTSDDHYYVMLGTSMASPICAGAAALYLQRYPSSSPDDIYSAIKDNATTDSYTGSVPNSTWGYGKLDIYEAIQGGGPLPITLTSFTAEYTNDELSLLWTTQSESNNMGWNIYRGENEDALSNNQAIKINPRMIVGAGTTNEPTEYQYRDYTDIVYGRTYWYWIESISTSGTTENFGPISIFIPNHGYNPDPPQLMFEYGLFQNFPNPFNPTTQIQFRLIEPGPYSLEIYNNKGEKVKTLQRGIINGENIRKTVSASWNGKDDFGNEVASGIYFIKLTGRNFVQARRMIMMK